MARQISAALAIAAAFSLFGLASTASADAVMSASQQRDNKADHDKWNKTAPVVKKTASSSDEDDSAGEAKTTQAKLSPKHRGELNGHLHLGEW